MAQWIARSPPKGQVGGSTPPRGTIKINGLQNPFCKANLEFHSWGQPQGQPNQMVVLTLLYRSIQLVKASINLHLARFKEYLCKKSILT